MPPATARAVTTVAMMRIVTTALAMAEAAPELARTAAARVAKEQAAAIARALQEDQAHRQADLEEVAEKEAEALPWARPADS